MRAEEFAAQENVSRETLERLKTYEALLRKWTPKINLVSRSTLDDFWSRHILDSTQILALGPDDAHEWVDLGTGGGFPGVVIAILAAERNPDLSVTCVESDLRKATFLRTVLRETGVSGSVIAERIEAVEPLSADVVSARALAPLPKLLELAEPHLAPGGVALFPKGAEHDAELKEALETWSFRADKIRSRTHPEAVILRIGEIERV